jgi:hypothetical protein
MHDKRIYLYGLMGLLALVVTWYFNFQFIASDGEGNVYLNFFLAGFANPAATSLTIDLTITMLLCFVWIYREAKLLSIPYPWIYCLIALTIAVAVALAAFLIAREKYRSQISR